MPYGTKTQVTDAQQNPTGILRLVNQRTDFGGIDLNTYRTEVVLGGVTCYILDRTHDYIDGWTPAPGHRTPPVGWNPYMNVGDVVIEYGYEGQGLGGYNYDYFLAAEQPLTIEKAYSVSVTGAQLWREETLTAGAGRENAPVFSADRSITDTWVLISPATWSVEFGDLSDGGVQTWDGGMGMWMPVVSQILYWTFQVWQACGNEDTEYANATLEWAGVPVDFSGMYKAASFFTVRGAANELTLTVDTTTNSIVAPVTQSWVFARPHIIDFSRFSVRDRDGTLLGDLGINGPFRADTVRYPWTATDCLPKVESTPIVAGTPIILSVNQIRSLGTWIQSAGLVSVDGGAPSYDSPDYGYDMVSSYVLEFQEWGGY